MDGRRLAEMRKKKGVKQWELANVLQVYPDTISRYERNIIEPPDDMKIKICRYLNVKLDYLVGLTDKMEPLVEEPKDDGSDKGFYFRNKDELAKEFANFLVYEESYDDLTKDMILLWNRLSRDQKLRFIQQLKREV